MRNFLIGTVVSVLILVQSTGIADTPRYPTMGERRVTLCFSASSIREGLRLLTDSPDIGKMSRAFRESGETPLLVIYEGSEDEFEVVKVPPATPMRGLDNGTRLKMVPTQRDSKISVAVSDLPLSAALSQFAASSGLVVRSRDTDQTIVFMDPHLANETTWPLNRQLDPEDNRVLTYEEAKNVLSARYGWDRDSAEFTKFVPCENETIWQGSVPGATARDLLIALLKSAQKKGVPAMRWKVQPGGSIAKGQTAWNLVGW